MGPIHATTLHSLPASPFRQRTRFSWASNSLVLHVAPWRNSLPSLCRQPLPPPPISTRGNNPNTVKILPRQCLRRPQTVPLQAGVQAGPRVNLQAEPPVCQLASQVVNSISLLLATWAGENGEEVWPTITLPPSIETL